jgi:hypothetical protein
MPRRAAFRMSDLRVVEHATHEPIIVGDFVRLASGSPLGLVIAANSGVGQIVWFGDQPERSTLPLICLRPAASGVPMTITKLK